MDSLLAKRITRRLLGVPFLLGDKVRKIAALGNGYEGVVTQVNPKGIHVEITKASSDPEFHKGVGRFGGSVFSHYELIE